MKQSWGAGAQRRLPMNDRDGVAIRRCSGVRSTASILLCYELVVPLDYDAELLDAIDLDAMSFRVPGHWEGLPGAAFGGFAVGGLFVSAAAHAEHPRPLSIHARFHRPVPVERSVRLVVEPERKGRTVESFRASLVDGDRVLVTASAAFGSATPVELQSLTVEPPQPLEEPVALWTILERRGLYVPKLMRHVGFRVAPDTPPARGWHVHNQWPATESDSLNTRAAVAIMCIDAFVAPGTMIANGVDPSRPWPAAAPSVDIAAWFQDLDADAHGAGEVAPGWLDVVTSVPATRGGYAVGRTQVWARDRLFAEGMSQVMLVPMMQP